MAGTDGSSNPARRCTRRSLSEETHTLHTASVLSVQSFGYGDELLSIPMVRSLGMQIYIQHTYLLLVLSRSRSRLLELTNCSDFKQEGKEDEQSAHAALVIAGERSVL
ncbi:hypothetical protein EYF80_033877 [Liparis tanakae]|uniref:Uncharacterized protein n=1 Tax=Liparis tanakae TaxID=230148 RepID=A0A4Z2GQC2_9TELE|nr:hypothetical protein EYF80_033877 [Liparis tanakae]